MVIGINPPAALGVASFVVCANSAPLESVSGVFSGSNSPYYNLPANSTQALCIELVSLCFHASLPAVEDLASQPSFPFIGDGTSGHKMGRKLELAALQRPALASRPSKRKDLSKLPSPQQGRAVTGRERSGQSDAVAR